MWIEIGSVCRGMSVLPRAGGALDQIPKEMQKLTLVMEVLHDEEERDSKLK